MTNPYPLPRETRESAAIDGDGRATYGPFAYRIWDDDVVAYVSRQGAGFATEDVVAAKSAPQAFETFSVTFAPALLGGDSAIVMSRRLQERLNDVVRGGSISGAALEKELSVIGTVLQELRRDVDRSVSLLPGSGDPDPLGPPQPGRVLVGNSGGTGFNYGPTATEVAGAEGWAIEAQGHAEDAAAITAAAIIALGIIRDETTETVNALVDEGRDYRDQTIVARNETYASEERAEALVLDATAGFTGYPDGLVLDEGFEGPYDGFNYFNLDEGFE